MYRPPEEVRQHELDGGIIIVGRPTFKEFMTGLKKGWTDGLEKVDYDEQLARELESDGHFDELTEEEGSVDDTQIPSSTPSLPFTQQQPPLRPSSLQLPHNSEAMNTPATIPLMPPLLLVTFTNYIGFTQIPIMIWDFFNQRHKVRSGAQAGYRLVMKHSRPIIPPPMASDVPFSDMTMNGNTQGSDLDFDKRVESFYKKSLSSIPADIEKAREKYYETLPARLVTARALARGEREPTKAERENPPPTEVELSAERMKKEQRWRHDLEGWEIVKPAQNTAWDDRFRGSLCIFTDP
jgi:import inner membrane translocase subunit TIM54